jgi:hypothetical protein
MMGVRLACALGLLAVGASACAPVKADTDIDPTYYRVRSSRQVVRDGKLIWERRVVVSHALARNKDRVVQLARTLCRTGTCVIMVWEADAYVPQQNDTPLTPAQAAAEVARYRIDRDNTFELFECYAYGDPGEAC